MGECGNNVAINCTVTVRCSNVCVKVGILITQILTRLITYVYLYVGN